MTPTLQNLRARHTRMGQLLDEIELLERASSTGSLVYMSAATGTDLGTKALARMIDGQTYGDVRASMIAEREQALADLGLRTPGVRSGKYAQPLDPVYEATPFSPWWERYPAIERFRAYAANEEPRIPATLEESHVE